MIISWLYLPHAKRNEQTHSACWHYGNNLGYVRSLGKGNKALHPGVPWFVSLPKADGIRLIISRFHGNITIFGPVFPKAGRGMRSPLSHPHVPDAPLCGKALPYSRLATMDSNAAMGSSAFVMGRPTTICEAPFSMASRGVATRF